MPRKWAKCELQNGTPHITGPSHKAKLTVNKRPRKGQYGVKLKKQSKTSFCRDHHDGSFMHALNSIAQGQSTLHGGVAHTLNSMDAHLHDFVDMCRISKGLLANYKRGNYSRPTVVVRAPRQRGKGRTLHIAADFRVVLSERPLGSGAYGEVYSADGPDGPYEKLIVKRNRGDVDEKSDLTEVLIQTVLFCDQRTMGGVELGNAAAKHNVKMPFIPKVIYYAGARNSTGSYIVMEKVDMTLVDFLASGETTRIMAIDCLKQLCVLLKHYQTKFKFMHRDMHGQNVMVKFDPHNRADVRVVLIDFGFSCLKVPPNKKKKLSGIRLGYPLTKGEHVTKYDTEHVYRRHNEFNPTLDLVTLLVYLYDPCVVGSQVIMDKLPEIQEQIVVPIFNRIVTSRRSVYGPIRMKYKQSGGLMPTNGKFRGADMPRMGFACSGYMHSIFYWRATKVRFKECSPTNLLRMLDRIR